MEVVKIKGASQRVYVAGDAHYWPGKPSAGHRALCGMLSTQWAADVLVLNGDMFDFPGISKYPPNDWPKHPSVEKGIKCVQARVGEIATAAQVYNPKVKLVWSVGNHDARFNKALASKAGAFKGLPGTKLSDYFPAWQMCGRVEIGDTVIKHELKGGSNPLKSNLLATGKNIVTGHHHCQNVLAYTDYSGTRYAVDHGMLGATVGPQFDYGEGNPVNWRSGFVILQFHGAKLLPPQLCTILDEKKGACWHNGYLYKF